MVFLVGTVTGQISHSIFVQNLDHCVATSPKKILIEVYKNKIGKVASAILPCLSPYSISAQTSIPKQPPLLQRPAGKRERKTLALTAAALVTLLGFEP